MPFISPIDPVRIDYCQASKEFGLAFSIPEMATLRRVFTSSLSVMFPSKSNVGNFGPRDFIPSSLTRALEVLKYPIDH